MGEWGWQPRQNSLVEGWWKFEVVNSIEGTSRLGGGGEDIFHTHFFIQENHFLPEPQFS